jgi:ABC-2 type transport system ATP-binding protein
VARPQAPPPPPAIQAVGLTKSYRGRPAVDRLSFSVPRGRVTAFVGPNGSGKTTTIRMLLGLVRPDAGTATVLGASLSQPRAYLPRVGALVESPAFEPELSGRRNLKVLATLARTPVHRVEAALAAVGNKPYRAYSLGMRQRLGIAAALLGDPELLLLDEPTNGLDPGGMQEVRHLLRRLADAGRTVFVSSHLLAEVEQLCDHVVVLREGRLVHQGDVRGLTAGGRRLEDAVLALTGRGSL